MMCMTLIIVGLGNPGKEYETTRHNAGRSAVTLVAKQEGFDEFVFNKTSNALVSKGAIGGENTTLVLPETMMNNSGKAAAALRFWSGFSGALLFCPLIIGWVTKAMETITREAMGLPPQFRLWTTIIVVVVALISCTLSGLYGVVYNDLIQFFLATVGTIVLAVFSVRAVGGLGAMVATLSHMPAWHGHAMGISPSIGHRADQMSPWNALGYFGLLWVQVALAGGYQAQRVLACKDSRHASFAMLLHTMVYYACVCWPWILVGLCSIILLPNLGSGVPHDAAYPRMIVQLLPVGLRGLLIVALLSAFMSCISTLFNWGSSYVVNDIYKRFVVREASGRHYVWVGRLATLLMAAGGAIISFYAHDIQSLLTIAFVIGAGCSIVGLLRWFWWRMNAMGELAAAVGVWVFTPLMLFGPHIFDGLGRALFGPEARLSGDANLLGARMLLIVVLVTTIAVATSLLTCPTEEARLEQFILRAKPFHFFWKPVIRRLGGEFHENESFGRTLLSWAIAFACVYALMYGIGKILLGSVLTGLGCLAVFIITLWLTVRRINRDFDDEDARAKAEPGANQPIKEAVDGNATNQGPKAAPVVR